MVMKGFVTDMTKAAMAGYAGEPCGAYFSSPLWLAHKAGEVLKGKGHGAPTVCVMGAGYSVKVVSDHVGKKVKFWGGKLDKSLVVTV